MPRSIALLAVCLLALLAAPTQAQFQEDIDRWTGQDALNAPPADAMLFIGSSSIRRWERLTREFADYEVIQRGFGGAEFDDLNTYIADIVLPYAPRAIVIFAGTNDIAAGDNAAEVFQDYQDFVAAVHATLPLTDIFYIGITPTPGRFASLAEETNANNSIAAFASNDARLHYIDTPSVFLALNPPSDPAFTNKFIDPVHLTQEGYDLWISIIRPAIEAIVPPDKSRTPNPLAPLPGEGLLFDFGPSNTADGDQTLGPDILGNHWNNWHPMDGGTTINAGEQIAGLVNSDGTPNGMQLVMTAGFSSNGKLNGGLLSADPNLLGPLGIDTATHDFLFCTGDAQPGGGDDDSAGGFYLRGLEPSGRYVMRFFGSRTTGESRVTEYKVNGRNQRVQLLQTSGTDIGADGVYDGNDDEVAELRNIRSDDFGQVFVDLTLVAGSFAYINALQLLAFDGADFDQDCDVDADDGLAISIQLSGPDLTALARDVDGDGDADLHDMALLAERLGSSCP